MRAKLKITAMALTALFALSAVSASAAQAAESALDVNSTTASAFVTADQIAGNPLKLALKKETGSATLSTVKCNVGKLTATVAKGTNKEATLTPSYGECTLGGLAAEVKPDGCRFTLTASGVFLIFNFHITLCLGSLEIVQGTCVIKIGNQGPLSHAALKNVAGTNPTHVEANVTVSMIAWSGGAGCPVGIAGVNGTNAELSGPTTIKAFNDTSGVEGAQVSLEAT